MHDIILLMKLSSVAVLLLGLAQAQTGRHALVVGNGAYKHVNPLKNPAGDANDMTALLEQQGFRVQRLLDAGAEQFDRAITTFASSLAPGDVALFFYAGHGVQVAGENYMIPVDFQGADDAAVRYRCQNTDRVRDRIAQSGARLVILIFDACRNNPFTASKRLLVYGLAPMEAGLGTLIAYSTGPGQLADDNPRSRNGLFTGELLKFLREPADLLTVFRKTRESVYAASQGKQRPWIHEDLVNEFYLAQGTPPKPATTTTIARTPQADPMIEGQALFARGRFEEALKQFELARRADPENAFAHHAAGVANFQLGFTRLAVDCFRMAIRLKPAYAAAYYNRGRAYLKETRYDLAIEDFTWAIEQEPENPIHYPLRGRAQFLKRVYEEAMSDYNRAIELNPGDASAFSGRAEVHARQGRMREAEADRRRAAELAPRTP